MLYVTLWLVGGGAQTADQQVHVAAGGDGLVHLLLDAQVATQSVPLTPYAA